MNLAKNWIAVFIIFLSLSSSSQAQRLLNAQEAVTLALENNLGIDLAQNAIELAKNNTSKFNSGKLPTVSLDGGANFNVDNTSVNTQDGRSTKLTAATSYAANVAVNVGYTLYDGYIRKHNMSQLQERHQLSELEAKAVMENIAAQTLSQYYQVASLTSNLSILEAALLISKQRRNRAKERLEFGQGSGLDILNADVDLNNDSLTIINTQIQLNNAKRRLNNLMLEIKNLDYKVDMKADFISNLSRDELLENMFDQNISLQQIDRNISIGDLSIDLAKARKLPTIGTSLSYGYNYSNNNSASFLSSSNSNGLTVGLNAKWNLFDGGSRRVAEENAIIQARGLQIQKEQLKQNLEYDFDVAWANYENALYVYQSEGRNVEINKKNFERTEEKFNIGQINSVDFRQAQLNLFNTETRLNSAKYQVKIAEVELLLLSGQLLN